MCQFGSCHFQNCGQAIPLGSQYKNRSNFCKSRGGIVKDKKVFLVTMWPKIFWSWKLIIFFLNFYKFVQIKWEISSNFLGLKTSLSCPSIFVNTNVITILRYFLWFKIRIQHDMETRQKIMIYSNVVSITVSRAKKI